MDEERIIALELSADRQGALLEDLSRVLHEQQGEIGKLQEEVRRLQARLAQAESRIPTPRPEKPPHY